jgi:hypothetical protein
MGYTMEGTKKDTFVPKGTDVCVLVNLAVLNENRTLLCVLFEGTYIHIEAKGSEILNFNPEYNYLCTLSLTEVLCVLKSVCEQCNERGLNTFPYHS